MLADSDASRVVALAQVQQAVEKALKGFLIARGWDLEKTHDLSYLLGEAREHEESLEAFTDLCAVATEAYLEHRYPGTATADLGGVDLEGHIERSGQLLDRLAELALDGG